MEEGMALQGKIEELEEEARRLGLYLEQAAVMNLGPGTSRLVARFTIGDVAWSSRVQEPEADRDKRELAEVDARMADDDFIDTRERIKRNLAAGRDALDDGDER